MSASYKTLCLLGQPLHRGIPMTPTKTGPKNSSRFLGTTDLQSLPLLRLCALGVLRLKQRRPIL